MAIGLCAGKPVFVFDDLHAFDVVGTHQVSDGRRFTAPQGLAVLRSN